MNFKDVSSIRKVDMPKLNTVKDSIPADKASPNLINMNPPERIALIKRDIKLPKTRG